MTIQAEREGAPRGIEEPREPSTEIVPLGPSGTELMLRPESAIARFAATPSGVRLISAGRTTASAVGTAARVGGRAVATATITAPAPRVGRVAGRFIAGRPLAGGDERTDATFFRAGRHQPREIDGQSADWSYLPGWKRSAARLGSLLIGGGGAYMATPGVVTVVAGVLAALIGVWGSYGLWRRVQTHGHHTRYLRPLHEALRTAVGQSATRPEQWLHIPPDFKQNPGVELRIDLPSAYDGTDGTANHIKTVVRNKLGLATDTVFSFHAEGNRPYVTFREPTRPPNKVTYADIMARISQAKETAPIIGLAAGLRAITVDLENDSPHVLVSAGSGAGKSVLLRTILSQALAKGGYGIVLDIKRVSHMWADNLLNCEYHRSAEAIHERLLGLQVEVNRRNDLAERYADIDGNTEHVDVGPRIWLLAEEMNATINRLNKYWREIKEKGDPNTSPAVEALLDLLFMGRQIKIHVVSVAQMASARTMGGPEARENYATRCLSRYTMNAWRMLCPEVWPMPKKPKQIGRWQIVTAGVATETQIAYFTPREARELAQLGRPDTIRDQRRTPAESLSQESHDRDDLGQGVETVSGTAPAPTEPGPVPGDAPDDVEIVEAARLIGLRQAVAEDLVSGIELAYLRKLPQRDNHFPEPRGKNGVEKLYDASELGVWARNRRLAKAVEDDSHKPGRPVDKGADNSASNRDTDRADDDSASDIDGDEDDDDDEVMTA